MQMILVIIPLIFYAIILIAFFRISDNTAKIRKSVDNRTSKFWLTEYNKAKIFGNTDEMKKAIQSAVFYDVATASDTDKKTKYDNNKHLHLEKFTALGLEFPEWNREDFN